VRFARAQLSLVLSGRRLLAPTTLVLFGVIGVYVYRPNPVQGSFAVTTLLSALSCAWLVAAVEREVSPTAAAILAVRAGGAVRGWRGRLVLVGVFAVAVAILSLAWPTATGAFDRSPGVGDLVAAAIAHLACGAVGGTLALLLGPPMRVATAFATILAVIIGSIALTGALGIFAGPGGVAHALSQTPRNAISVPLAAATVIGLLQAVALAYAARAQARWRG
jgi:hypothetical protein